MFATEEGKIFGWNPGVAANDAVDTHVANSPGAIYKGLAFASTAGGNFLYATDFHNGHVDVFNGALQPAGLPAGAFTDPTLPSGYAPFGIQNVGGTIVVTFRTSQPSRSISTDTMQRYGLSLLSSSRDSFLSASRSSSLICFSLSTNS